jgi:hypothetical protein
MKERLWVHLAACSLTTFFRACTRFSRNEPLRNNGRLLWSISPFFTRYVTVHSNISRRNGFYAVCVASESSIKSSRNFLILFKTLILTVWVQYHSIINVCDLDNLHQYRAERENFSLRECVKTSIRAQPNCCPLGTTVSVHKGNVAEA